MTVSLRGFLVKTSKPAAWYQISGLPLSSSATLSKLLNFLILGFLICETGIKLVRSPRGSLEG